MKIFVLRRGESQPLGPLTATEVAEMRIRWQLSDADYYRTEGSDEWSLVGRLAPAFRRHLAIRAIFPTLVASIALALVVTAFTPLLRSHSQATASPDSPATLAAGLPLEVVADPLVPEETGTESRAPSLDAAPAASPDLIPEANI